MYLSSDSLTSAFVWLLQWAAGAAVLIAATVVRLAGNQPRSEAGSQVLGSQPEGRLGFTLIGFIGGIVLGLGLCWLAFSFEFTGGPSSGVTIRALGVNVFTTHGLFVDFVPPIVYVLLDGLMGIGGAIVGARVRQRKA